MSSVKSRFAILFSLAGLASGAWAAELEVSDAWIRLIPGGAPAGGYFTLRNGTNQPAVLVGASSSAFEYVMMHRTTEEKGLSRMLPVDRVEVPAGGTLAFAPSGYHLMLTKPSRKVAVGDRIAITLEFTGGHKSTVQFEVRGPAGK
jgi:copper(I)-binding protein